MATIAAKAKRPADKQCEMPAMPGGLWESLGRAAPAPAAPGVWGGLQGRAAAPPGEGGLWAGLAERADPSRYRPRAIPDVAEEQVVEGDQTFTVIRSPRGTYLRLTPQQRALWHGMDGSRTVAQLATQGFLQFGLLLPVGDLVAALRSEGFLADRPVGVYQRVAATLDASTAEGWGRRLVRAFMGQTWRIPHIDGLYGAIYRSVGWLFFTPPALVLAVLLMLAGVGAFVALLLDARGLQVLKTDGLVTQELALLWLALLVSFVLHESAHALAVKHFGRTLHSGGVMLYFGMPAAYVDTSDIWRSPRRARILVSAAGPAADLLLGGLAALYALLLPDAPFRAGAFKLSLACYVATLFNANPLLELDGYFILVDWLRLPDLRRRALEFVRGPLWQELRRRVPLEREERIFALYGVLTLAYSALALVFAVQFWRHQLQAIIAALWVSGDPPQQAVAAALVVVVAVPTLAGLLFAGMGLGRVTLGWLLRRGYGRRPDLLAVVAMAAAIAMALTVHLSHRRLLDTAVPLLLWLVALAALQTVRPDYRGAAIAPALDALRLTTLLAALAALVRVLPLEEAARAPIWTAADGLAFVFLVLVGFNALLDVDLREAPGRELLIAALLLILAFAAGAIAIFQAWASWPGAPPLALAAAGAPAYFGAVALALLMPHLLGLADSRLVWSWYLIWCAILAETVAYVVNLGQRSPGLDTLAAGLWAMAWLIHLATLRQITPDEMRWPHPPSMSEAERLRRAVQFCYAGCYRLLRAVHGLRRAKALDDRMDVLAATANWDVTLDLEQARIGASAMKLPLNAQGARYAEVLRYTFDTVEQIAGTAFARRAIQAAYDALPWPERETAERLCFPDTPWARDLSRSFGDERSMRLRLLRQIDLFLGCDDDELAALALSLESRRLSADTVVLRAGLPAPGVWVVEAGEIMVRRGEQVTAELHRGDTFGVRELLEDRVADQTYRATVSSSLLFIPSDAFLALAHHQTPQLPLDQEVAATLRLLESMPIFAGLSRNTLRALAQVAGRHSFPARSTVVQQGEPSGMFYIIEHGRAAVMAHREQPDGTRKPLLIARIGPKEFFGELEMLRGTSPFASVIALSPLSVLTLPHTTIQPLLGEQLAMAGELERIGSGRLLELRKTTQLA